MADELIFPIGFDLEKGVAEAEKEWENKYAKKMEDFMAKRAVGVKLDFSNLDDVKTRLAKLKIEPITPETKSAIRELAGELRTLAKALEQVQKYSASRGAASTDAVRVSKIRVNEERAQAQAALAAQRAAKAEDNLAAARLKAARAANVGAGATRNANKAYHEQSSYLQRLTQRLAAYWSIRQAGNFLTSIREVTAEFELQRVSLGAIIQDQQRANQIFAEIKSFALTSPLKILDLTKYTKQVAAYGFETEKLFSTTKMLADISVGLGVDMSRLSLFLGQVFATGHLRASEVRQATEAGIPLVDKLAKKLEELNGRAYTAADVMDMISKRAISYEMVEQVFKDMTSAGGEFYNMQVKQSQTLYGMWSKLGDAAAIMYDQIGNTSSINAGMKLAIRSIEQMMRNWKTTARVLDTVAVATAVYVIGLKNTAIASKAVSAAEATRLAITNKQIIATPKLIASIIGQNTATKISTALTKAHTMAMIKQSAATNMLSKGFWKLTAAMLANPWVAAASAIALVGTALIHFIGNTETAAERAETLNNSVASLKNLEDTTKPLIDTYNELINKIERTAEEQKKLSEVTHELAKQYPGAITAVGNFGEEIDLAADKLNKLYQTEKKARMDNTRYELGLTEKKIEETENKIAALEKQLLNSQKWGGGQSGIMVAMSDDDKGKILKQIDDLRYGENGQGGLQALKEAAQTTRDALEAMLKGVTIEQLHIERFGAWKKKLTEFNKDVGGIKVKLFDDSTIKQFSTIEEALDAAAKKYKEAAESVEKYNETLKRGVNGLGQEQFDKIAAERDEAQATKELSEEMLKFYNAFSLALKAMFGKGGRTSDPRLSILQEMVSTLRQVNKEYDELAKKEGMAKALADTQSKYANTFKYLQSLATKYKFNLPDFGVPTDAASLTKYLDALKGAMRKLPKSEKAVLSLETDIADLKMAEAQKRIESQLKILTDRISRTKTAKEFYEKILGQTGNRGMAERLTDSIFGENGEALNKEIADRMRKMVERTSAKLPDFVFNADMSVNAKALRNWVEANKEALGDVAKELTKFADESEKDTAKMVEGWLKATEKAKTYGDKLADVYRKTATEIKRIETEMAKGNISRSDATGLIAGFRRKEAEEVAKLQYEAFKDSPLYVQMFDNLDHASTRMLKNMKSRLTEMQGAWRNLDPTQLKEMQSRLREIDEQLAKRNPFKTLADSMREYYRLRTEGDARGNKTRADADADVIAMTDAYIKAEEKLAKVKSDPQATDMQLEAAAQMVDYTKRQKEEAEKVAENWKKVEDAIGLSANQLLNMTNWASDIAKGIADISEAMGADANDVQYWNDIASALGEISGGIQDVVKSAMSGNVVGVISSALTAVPKMFVGFVNLFSAGKIRKANKEIEQQQRLLEGLEYTYGRLEKAADRLFGRQYISNYNEQLKTLQAQQRAYQKQAEAERSKGKKADKDRIRDYENQARETADRIKDLQDDLIMHFTGSSRTDVARQMAKSWIDARASMSDTFAAIKGDYQEMVKSMMVEGVAARVVENALSPLWQRIEDAYKSNDPEKALEQAIAGMDRFLNDANNGLEVLWLSLKAKGYDMKKLMGDASGSEYSGIAKNIAGATSEEINTVAGIGNTMMYHTSFLPRMDEKLAMIVAMMERGGGSLPSGGGTTLVAKDYTDMLTTANQHLSSLPRMERHLAEIHTMLGRVITTQNGRFGVSTILR